MIYVFVYFFLAFCVYILFTKHRSNPPGPYGLPIIGYYPFLEKDPVESFHKLSKRYGDIMSINMLGETFWVLNSYEAIKEALIKKGEIFAARANEYGLFQLLNKGSVVIAEGDEWRTEIKFILAHLTQLGMGKSEFDMTIHNILDDVDKYIESKNGEAHDFSDLMHNFTFNVTSEMICGKRYPVDSPAYVSLNKWMKDMFSALPYMNLTLSGEVFRLFVEHNTSYQSTLEANQEKVFKFTTDLIEERMNTFDPNHCRDLLDYFLKEASGPKGEYFQGLHKKLANLIFANDTPASVLCHSLFIIAAYENVQQRVFEEIDNTIGNETNISYQERNRLPYTMAVISEIMRFVSLIPLGIVHVNKVPTTLMGYTVPHRQKVIPNAYALSRDARYFANPNQFDPNNFLDEKGYYKSNAALIPFGVGIRKCLGMKLAEVEIFIALVRLIQKFEWKLHESYDLNSRLFTLGNIRFMQSFKVYAHKRQ